MCVRVRVLCLAFVTRSSRITLRTCCDGDIVDRMSMDPDASPKDSCRLSTRSWTITDEDGREEQVEGPGVVGQPTACICMLIKAVKI